MARFRRVNVYVPLLPPWKHELDLSTNNGKSWALQNLIFLAPFSIEMWRMLTNVIDEEIEECKV